MLEITGLTRAGLKPVSFTLSRGNCIAVRGQSGSGKTLLLRAIADLDSNEGRVTLDGQDRNGMPAPAWRRQVVYLPSASGWWADTVGSHFGDRDGATSLLKQLRLPDDAFAWPVARCSTGELARLALVRALAVGPKVLLLDEPTAALDAEAIASVEALLRDRIASGMSALWVTHDAAQAARVAERSLMVEAGTVREGANA